MKNQRWDALWPWISKVSSSARWAFQTRKLIPSRGSQLSPNSKKRKKKQSRIMMINVCRSLENYGPYLTSREIMQGLWTCSVSSTYSSLKSSAMWSSETLKTAVETSKSELSRNLPSSGNLRCIKRKKAAKANSFKTARMRSLTYHSNLIMREIQRKKATNYSSVKADENTMHSTRC